MSGSGSEAAAALRVPYDVLEQVAVFADQPSLLALCHVSHEVSSLATRQLYRYVVLTSRNDDIVTFLELITRKQSLGKLLMSLSIRLVSHLPPADNRIFVDALRLMRMLRHLDITNIEAVGNGCTDVLRGLTLLESFKYIAWHNATITGPVEMITLDSLPPLKRFHMDQLHLVRLAPRLRHVEHLLLRSADTLVSLTILNHNFDLGGFLAETGPATVWPHMKELTVHKISAQFPAYSFPNLEQLHIYDSSDETWRGIKRVPDPVGGKLAISSNSVPVVFPQLTRLSTVSMDSRHFSDVLEQRNITHLAVRFLGTQRADKNRRDFVPLMQIFSFNALRSLQCSFIWSSYLSGTLLGRLPEVLQQCPALHYLGITVKKNSKNALELVSALFESLLVDDVQPQALPPLLWYISVRALKPPFASLRAPNDTNRVSVEVNTISPLFAQFLGLRCFQLDMPDSVDVWRRMDLKAGGNSAAEPVISRDANFRLPATFEEVVARVELECAWRASDAETVSQHARGPGGVLSFATV